MLSLRSRSVWEAADSGALLWRSNAVYFFPFFVLPVGIAACVIRLALSGENIVLSYLFLWWLKPLFDRMVLYVVSRRFFDSEAGTGSLVWNLGAAIFRGLAGDLLWRRFSPGRAVCMPIRVLERLEYKQFIQRKKQLAAGGLGFCSFLSILGFFLELMLLLGEIVFVIMICQILFPSALIYMRGNIEAVEIFIFAASCLNYLLAGSLYVCMGFGLYINSRVETEGWDLQLLFKKFAGITTILLTCLFLLAPRMAYAEPDDSPSKDGVPEVSESAAFFPEDFPLLDGESLAELHSILDSPDFGGQRDGWGVRLKNSPEPVDQLVIVPWMERIRRIFALILRFIAVLAIGVLVVFLAYWFRKFWQARKLSLTRRFPAGTRLYANPLMSGQSPESLFEQAESCFFRGLVREAWAACLAGCLGAYTEYRSLVFPACTTEYGCLDLVRRTLPDQAPGFRFVVQNWICLAYGGIPPGEGAFEQALDYGRSLSAAGVQAP